VKLKHIGRIALLMALLMMGACSAPGRVPVPGEPRWHAGFGSAEIALPCTDGPFYIAGYHNGVEIGGVRDLQQVCALWLDAGGPGTLLLSVDCIGLGSNSVERIRARLAPLLKSERCLVHVVSTHDHAGADTLGLWGPVGVDGKDPEFMENLFAACEEAAKRALADRRSGRLFRADVETQGMLRDSRDPQIMDETLHMLRFEADEGAGIRLMSYGAHAESLRGANIRLSRDYPGVLCELVTEQTGDRTMFLPGAVGGLVMTKEFVETADMEENLLRTGSLLAGYALSGADWRELAPELSDCSVSFAVPLENTVFLYYKFLGILGNKAVRGGGSTGYSLETSLSLLRLGDTALLLIPGEIFPELVFGGGREKPAHPEIADPEPLADILARHGTDDFFIVGLADDELGYIVPPRDFLTDERAPYLKAAAPSDGSRHYEETNSVGPECAERIAEALRVLLGE